MPTHAPIASPALPQTEAPLCARLAHVVVGTFLLRATNLGLTFLIGRMLVRMLGADGCGVFVYNSILPPILRPWLASFSGTGGP